MQDILERLARKRDAARAGGGARRIEAQHAKLRADLELADRWARLLPQAAPTQ